MANFVKVDIGDGTEVLFQSTKSDLVRAHGGPADVEELDMAVHRLEDIAAAAHKVSTTLRERMTPDELALEIGVGVSGKAGWFFANSSLDANLKVTLTWTSKLKE